MNGKTLQVLAGQVNEMHNELHAILHVLIGEERLSKKEAEELKAILATMKKGGRIKLEDV